MAHRSARGLRSTVRPGARDRAAAALDAVQLHAHGAVHRAGGAQRGEAGVHLGAAQRAQARASGRPATRRHGARPGTRRSQRIPHHDVAIAQARHLAVGRERAEGVPAGASCRATWCSWNAIRARPSTTTGAATRRSSSCCRCRARTRRSPQACLQAASWREARVMRRRALARITPPTVTAPPIRVSTPGRSPSQTQPMNTAIGGEK